MDILIENETITQGPSAEGTILPCTGGCAGMEMLDELAEWDLVCISDSTGWEIAERYAENIRRDTGKSVRVRDYATGNLSAIRVLNALRTEAGNLTDERFRSLRADITDAEVIVLFANPRGDPSRGGIDTGIEGCISLERTPSNCTLELYQPYIENLKRVYEEVLALRAGSPTIVRALDLYNPLVIVHRERNMEKECTRCLEIFNTAVRQAASAFNVPLVSVHDAFNGPSHREDPREKGYIGPDGIHASKRGKRVIADLLSRVGYEPLEP